MNIFREKNIFGIYHSTLPLKLIDEKLTVMCKTLNNKGINLNGFTVYGICTLSVGNRDLLLLGSVPALQLLEIHFITTLLFSCMSST